MQKAITMLLVCAVIASAQKPAETLPKAQKQTPPRVGVTGEERRLSLQQAIELALRNNLDIAVERAYVQNAEALVRAAKGAFDGSFRWQPGIETRNTPVSSVLQGANGKLSEHAFTQNFYFTQPVPRTGAQVDISFENARNSTNTAFASLSPFYTSKLAVGLSIPLLRNASIDANRAAIFVRQKQAASSSVQFEQRVIDIVLQTQQAYWDLVAAREATQVQMDAVNLAAEQVARDERQISAGTLAPIELSAAKAELERRRDSLLTSITAITQTENQLKTLLLGDRSDPLWNLQLVPSDDQVPMPATQPAVGEAVAEAIRTRPELRDLNLQREANDEQLKLNRNQTRPQVNLTGTYSNQGLAGTAGSSANPFNDMFASLYGQINTISSQLGLPPVQPASFGAMPSSVLGDYGQAASSVFSGRYQSVQGGLQFQLTPRNRTAQSQLTQSLITGKRLDLLRRQTEQLIGVQVRNALQELESAEQRIRATEAAQQSARDKLESETRLFQNGQSTNFLVLTRQDEYLDARQRRVAAQADYNKALARYEQSVGSTLSAHDVKLQ